MNIFSWSVTLTWNKVISWLEFDYVENLSKTWDKIIFIFWDTELKKSTEVLDMLREKLWVLKNYDISISSEDKMELIHSTYEEW